MSYEMPSFYGCDRWDVHARHPLPGDGGWCPGFTHGPGEAVAAQEPGLTSTSATVVVQTHETNCQKVTFYVTPNTERSGGQK
jgi:hypothetical protein